MEEQEEEGRLLAFLRSLTEAKTTIPEEELVIQVVAAPLPSGINQ